MEHTQPDYILIYTDLLQKKFPEKAELYGSFFSKKTLSAMDIIRLNNMIFRETNNEFSKHNGKHRSYNKSDILNILDYQKKHKLNNSQLAIHYNLSRNTVAKWKKMFFV